MGPFVQRALLSRLRLRRHALQGLLQRPKARLAVHERLDLSIRNWAERPLQDQRIQRLQVRDIQDGELMPSSFAYPAFAQ
jgi:hypothetical protein